MNRINYISRIVLVAGVMVALQSCRTNDPEQEPEMGITSPAGDSQVAYEIFIRSFADSDGDGIGDLNGITAKLDYLKALGVDAIWITPVQQSPSYHKYDVVDYKQIDPEYGTLADYKNLIREAHRRDMRIIMDFVVNHTSDQHPWFQEAKKGKDSPYRDYYNWLTPKVIDSLGIATREQTGDSWEINPWHWAREGDAEKYYGLFWGGMPDLNFDNPDVREEIYSIGQYWLREVGVDGFRLDAAKHIYPDWEADKSVAFWVEFKNKMQEAKPDVYLIGEVWTTPDKVAPYFKGLRANFNIDAGLAIQEMLRTGHPGTLVQKLLDGYARYHTANPEYIDAPILGNHDQIRIGNVVNGDVRKLKMAAAVLLTLPGQPYLYYGEEIGMLGDKPDEFIREPFLWKNAAKDTYRTQWEKPRHSVDGKVTDLETQLQEPESLVNRYKNLIAARKEEPALAQVSPANLRESTLQQAGLLAFIRPHAGGDVLVLHNLGASGMQISLPGAEQDFSTVVFATENNTSLLNGVVSLPAFGSVVLKAKK